MREFFRNALKNLYVYCGNRQIEKMDDEEIKTLLDALERMSKLYNYIPEERQKEIIQNCLLTDKEYQNINVRTVAKWLELNGKHYFKEEAHQETKESDYVTGEEREKWLKKFEQAVLSARHEFTQPGDEGHKGAGTRLRENIEHSTGAKEYKFPDGFSCYAKSQEEADEIYSQIGK